jgi:hypothetical protein
MHHSEFQVTDNVAPNERLQLDLSEGKIGGTFNVVHFIDKDTKQFVFYLPSLQLSGYGKTASKAEHMLKFQLDDFFNGLLEMQEALVQQTLLALGWEKIKLNKGFTHTIIDIENELQQFNVEIGSVQLQMLETI